MASTLLVFLHVLGTTAWVGGQIVLGVVTVALRKALPEGDRARVLRLVARQAQPVLWGGFALAAGTGLLIVRGIGLPWSVFASGPFAWKAGLALLSAGAAAAHVVGARRGAPKWFVGTGAAVALLAGLGLVAVGAILRG